MHHLDVNPGLKPKPTLPRRTLSALRPISRNHSRFAFTCLLGITMPIGVGTALAANSAPASPQSPNSKSTLPTTFQTGQSPWLFTATAAGDAPAAAPTENQPALTVPLTPDKSPQPAPHMPPPQPPAATTPPALTTPPPASPAAPSTVSPFLNPAQAEGMQIANVRVAGNRVVPNDSILLQVSGTKPGAQFSIRQAEADRLNILNLGFFASVQYQLSPNLNDPSKIDVVFVVVENRVVTGYRIEGNKLVPTADILKVLVSQKGAVLNSQNVDKDSKAIQEVYRDKGYAALVSDVRQEDDGTTVYVIQEGMVSRIEITGLKKTKESIIRGLIATKPGDPFNEKKLQKDLNRIYDTGFFDDVTYKLNDDPDHPGALIVVISLKEKRTGQLSLGIGFDDRSKLSGYASIGDSNFRGSGKSVTSEIQVGSIKGFQETLSDSFVGKKNASYSVSVYSTTTYLDPQTVGDVLGTSTSSTFNYQEERTGARLNYTLPLDFDHTTNILFGYRNEKVRLFQIDDSLTDPTPIALPADSSGRISAPSIGFLRDTRDLRLDPSTGSREMIIVERGLNFLGGDEDFTKLDVDLRHYIPLMKPEKKGDLPKLVLAGRIVVGHSFGNLPAFEQYFIGGTDTVRGYDDDTQYGDNQIYGNLELRYRINKKFQFVVFTDSGTAYGGEFASSSSPDVISSVGVGIRLQTPIGPIRLDLGKGSNGLKTSFGIGSMF